MNVRREAVRPLAHVVVLGTRAMNAGPLPVRPAALDVRARRRCVLSKKVQVTARWQKMKPAWQSGTRS